MIRGNETFASAEVAELYKEELRRSGYHERTSERVSKESKHRQDDGLSSPLSGNIDAIVQEMVRRQTDDLRPEIIRLAREEALRVVCESPIEIILGRELCAQRPSGDSYGVKAQYQTGWHRYDFAVLRGGVVVAVVECDGDGFHREPAALQRDKANDEKAKTAKMHVFRFSGAKIMANACECADIVWTSVKAIP